jgi:hypothetical protein
MVEPILGHDDHHGADGQGERESAQCDIVQREIRVYQLVDGEWAAEGQDKHDNPEKLGGIFAFAQFCPHLRSALEDFVHVRYPRQPNWARNLYWKDSLCHEGMAKQLGAAAI